MFGCREPEDGNGELASLILGAAGQEVLQKTQLRNIKDRQQCLCTSKSTAVATDDPSESINLESVNAHSVL